MIEMYRVQWWRHDELVRATLHTDKPAALESFGSGGKGATRVELQHKAAGAHQFETLLKTERACELPVRGVVK
jgi:hypothetical protein